jgi:hypothetical protein
VALLEVRYQTCAFPEDGDSRFLSGYSNLGTPDCEAFRTISAKFPQLHTAILYGRGGGGGCGDEGNGWSASRSGRLKSRRESRVTLSMEGLECNGMI